MKGEPLHFRVDGPPVGTMNTDYRASVNVTIQADFFGPGQTITATCQGTDPTYDGLEVNRAGYKAELLFDIACMDRGIDTYSPQVQSSKVDRVTIAGQCMYRVQIKHPGQQDENGNPRMGLVNRRWNEIKAQYDGHNPGFDSDTCDLLAVLIKGHDEWLIIPSKEMHGKVAASLGSQFDVFKGAWRLLSTPKELWQRSLLYHQ